MKKNKILALGISATLVFAAMPVSILAETTDIINNKIVGASEENKEANNPIPQGSLKEENKTIETEVGKEVNNKEENTRGIIHRIKKTLKFFKENIKFLFRYAVIMILGYLTVYIIKKKNKKF